MFWQISLTFELSSSWENKKDGSKEFLENDCSTKLSHGWFCSGQSVFLPLYLLDRKWKFFFLINSCLLEMLDILHPYRFRWRHCYSSTHLFTFLIGWDVHLWHRERWLLEMDLWFSITFYNCDLVHYADLSFSLCSREYQNCQLTLIENYGLFGLFCLSFLPSLPPSLFSTHLLGRRGIYFYNHTYPPPLFIWPLEIWISFGNMLSILGC